MPLAFKAGFRGILGSPEKHNTLEFLQDTDGNYHLVIQETGGDMGNMRSGGVRIESASGDKIQNETHRLIKGLIDHIHNMHERYPNHPVYVVTK